jgi:hypothetical protein
MHFQRMDSEQQAMMEQMPWPRQAKGRLISALLRERLMVMSSHLQNLAESSPPTDSPGNELLSQRRNWELARLYRRTGMLL